MVKPDFKQEIRLWQQGHCFVAGLDESGRGPLAGPVVAAAVMIRGGRVEERAANVIARSTFTAFSVNSATKQSRAKQSHRGLLWQMGINLPVRDSKLLSARQRELLYQKLINHLDIDWGVGIVSEKLIDQFNILEATKLAMLKALANLSVKPDFLLIDGNFLLPNIWLRQKAIINGDQKVFSIAAASIIAKVTRDKIMRDFHRDYPQYGFQQHKGYGTKLHFARLAKHGPCAIHRRSFRPVSILV